MFLLRDSGERWAMSRCRIPVTGYLSVWAAAVLHFINMAVYSMVRPG